MSTAPAAAVPAAPARAVALGDKAPFGQKLAYGAGGMTENLAGQITSQMMNPVFNIGLGINPAVLSLVQMVFRLWDAMVDPLIGNISDNTRGRWGRRRPYIVGGGLLTALTMPLLWQAPRGWSEGALIGWLVVCGLVFYTAFSVWAMPYYSLGMEMTPDYHERTRVVAHRTFFSKFVSLLSGWLIALCSLPFFNDPVTGKPDLVRGMSVVSWGIGALILCVALLPGIFVKERYYAGEAGRQPKIGLRESLRHTLRCRPFLVILGVTILQIIGGSLVGSLGFYIILYHVCAGDLAKASIISGVQGTAMFLPGLLSVPLWTWLSEKLGKRGALRLTLVCAMLGAVLYYFCLSPEHPYLVVIPAVLMSSFGFAIWMLVPSMQADVADYDELQTGRRREGGFSSVFSWGLKLASTLTGGVSGFILVSTGFDVLKHGASQPPEVLAEMRLWYSITPVAFALAALLLLNRYPLSREVVADIRRQLEERRGRV